MTTNNTPAPDAGHAAELVTRFTEIVMESLFADSGDEYVTELLHEALHYVRQEFGDDIELFDLMHTITGEHTAPAHTGEGGGE